ncbi:MAG: DNA primase [Prevotella sp.]|nr:DNA primase [Prevotella sp.]
MIDPITIERIKEAADIVDVVSEFVSLKRSGSNYKGLCPFHNDRTPSFYVSPTRGTCHCFTCGEGGDSVGFLMKHEQLTYPEALRWLANRYGIEIEEKQLTDEQRKKQTEREAMFIANNWAAEYYTDILHNDVDGRAVGMQYFRQRGFRDDIINKFRLGFAPADRYAMPRKAKEKGYNLSYLEQTGLCYADNKGEMVDRFSGRAMFPWISVSGNVVAFGGRVLDQRTKGVNQKYINSPDSVIYHKDHELYGIYQAKKAIGKEDFVFMVEGYTDVISMHQCGIENVVANSGTALSVHQIHLLHRFTSNIVLLYDGDDAGIHAALRGTDMLLAEGMNVKVLLLPDGDDPDSFAKKHSADDFRKYVEEHQTDFIEFKTRVLLQGVTDPIKRSEAINSIVKSVSMITDQIVRATYIKECSSRLGISEQILLTTMNNFIRNYRDEQRKEEERNNRALQRNEERPLPPPSPVGREPEGEGVLPTQGGDDTPPQDAFLPPEAFSQPSNPHSEGNISSPSGSLPTGEGGGRGRISATPSLSVQELLIQFIIKYGEQVILENVETADGNTISLNVAQMSQIDLANDNLEFYNPLHTRILEEAVAHSEDEGFKAEKYFRFHADYDISQLAIKLTEDPVQLTKSYQMKFEPERLKGMLEHLLLDVRFEFVENRLAYIRQEMGLCSNDPEKYMSLIAEMQQLQKLRMKIAKMLGRA